MAQQPRRNATNILPNPVSFLDALLPILGGAATTILVLWLLRFGAAQVWSPFTRGGPGVLGALAVSALAGSIATSVLNRRSGGPLAPTACALGWALWGLILHAGGQGKYLAIVGGGLSREAAGGLIFPNAIAQSLSVAFALLLALGIGWLWARRRTDFIEETPISDDDLDGNGLKSFGTAFFFPLSTLLGGAITLNIFGFLVFPLGNAPIERLPSSIGIALWCGLLTMTALLVATWAARRAFRAWGSLGDVATAPLCIAVVAMLGASPLPASLLIWHTSAFELSSWAALGASLGYRFARSKMQP